MITLTKEQVLMLHDRLIEAMGGSMGIRDERMLASGKIGTRGDFLDFEIDCLCCVVKIRSGYSRRILL